MVYTFVMSLKKASICVALLTLASCSNGKWAWEKTEEKKADTPEAIEPGSVDGSEWEQTVSEFSDKEFTVGQIEEVARKCFINSEGSVFEELRRNFFRSAYEIEFLTQTRPLRKTNTRLLFFSVVANTKDSSKEINADESQSLSISTAATDSKYDGRLVLELEGPRVEDDSLLISKNGFPVIGYSQTIAEPGRNELGIIEEFTRKVKGVAFYGLKSSPQVLHFQRIISATEQIDVTLKIDTSVFRDCVTKALGN